MLVSAEEILPTNGAENGFCLPNTCGIFLSTKWPEVLQFIFCLNSFYSWPFYLSIVVI